MSDERLDAGSAPQRGDAPAAVSSTNRADLQAEANRRNHNDGMRDELTFAAVPQELKDKPQWVCWRWAVRKGRDKGTYELTKEPRNPNEARNAKAGVPSTWGTYEEAVDKWLAHDVAGIGFEFSDERDVTGIDFDHVLEGGTIVDDELAEIVAKCGTYVEVSPSGDGLHAFVLGGKPEGKTNCKRGGYEMYDHAHFFTVTGAVFDCHLEINTVPETVERIYDRYLGGSVSKASEGRRVDNEQATSTRDDREGVRPNDPHAIYNKLLFTKSDNLQSMLSGDISAYPSHSEADLAMCNHIIFYAGFNADLIDAVFKLTPLYRPAKWDRADSGSTHGMRTINRAMTGYTGEFYSWGSRLPHYLPSVKVAAARIRSELGGADGIAKLDDFSFYQRLCFWCDDFEELAVEVAKELGRLEGGVTPQALTKALEWRAKRHADRYGWGAFRYRKLTEKGYPGRTVLHNYLARDIMSEEHGCTIYGAPAVWLGDRWGVGGDYIHRECTARLDDIDTHAVRETASYIIKNGRARIESDFDGQPYVSFANGKVVNLATLREVRPQPDMLITGTVAAPWDPNAPNGEADSFLMTLADGDEAVFEVLCEIIGASMTAYPITVQIAWLIGQARNPGSTDGTANTGKSTFEDVLSDLVGIRNTSGMCPLDFGKRFDASSLVGKLVNIGDDISDVQLNANVVSILKKVATHNTIHAEEKFGACFDFQPTCNLVFSMNRFPQLDAVDSGFLRRVQIVPFRHMFEAGKDERMDMRRVMAKHENQARLALLGAHAANRMIQERRNRFTRIAGMDDELRRVVNESDSVRAWVDDQEITHEHIDHRLTNYVFSWFKDWAEEMNQTVPSAIEFSRRIDRIFHMRTTSSTDCVTGKRGNVFVRND